MTRATKPIWIIIFKSDLNGSRAEWVAASTLQELLSHYNPDGLSKIEKIEKTNNEITYYYE